MIAHSARASLITVLSDDELTYRVIGGFRWVYNVFDYGLLESAYTGALVHAWTSNGLRVEREVGAPLYFDGTVVAKYRLDLVVERRLIIEVKSCKTLLPEHIKQVMHYVRITDFELALLFNFGIQPQIKRFTMRNGMKKRSR